MNLKKGDKVKVIYGSQRGKIGTIILVKPKLKKIRIEGIGLQKKKNQQTKTYEDAYRLFHIFQVKKITNLEAIENLPEGSLDAGSLGEKNE